MGKHFEQNKNSRRLSYIYATLKVRFFHGFEKCESSSLYIVVTMLSASLIETTKEKLRVSFETLEATHFKSKSQPTSRLYCGRSIHALIAESFAAQWSTTRPLDRMNLHMKLSFTTSTSASNNAKH